eukprot:Skav233147  [mRNA]  locus=scaffold1669:146065:158744:+ [translate_table: standard]
MSSEECLETRPLAQRRPRELLWHQYLVLPVLVIACSASLIRVNQVLMAEDHFPHPFVLVLLQCFFSTIFALVMLWCCPSLFPALTDPDQKVELSLRFYSTTIFPIAFAYAISLVMGNLAYRYCTAAFLQMIKEGNILMIFAFSYAAGLESFTMTKLSILVVMLAATWSCVHGELNFNFVGFMVQIISGVGDATRTVLQSILLSGKGIKLDPMSVVLTVMSMVGLLLSLVMIIHIWVTPVIFVSVPSWQEVSQWRYWLALSVLNAFVLNGVVALFLKYLSPVTYIVTGNVKDIVVVCWSALMVHESISSLQVAGFTVQVCCVMAWTSVKQYGQLLPRELFQAEHFSEIWWRPPEGARSDDHEKCIDS